MVRERGRKKGREREKERERKRKEGTGKDVWGRQGKWKFENIFYFFPFDFLGKSRYHKQKMKLILIWYKGVERVVGMKKILKSRIQFPPNSMRGKRSPPAFF